MRTQLAALQLCLTPLYAFSSCLIQWVHCGRQPQVGQPKGLIIPPWHAKDSIRHSLTLEVLVLCMRSSKANACALFLHCCYTSVNSCSKGSQPVLQGWICNSSICMTRRGLKPTGIAIFEAQAKGFPSVAHYVQVRPETIACNSEGGVHASIP